MSKSGQQETGAPAPLFGLHRVTARRFAESIETKLTGVEVEQLAQAFAEQEAWLKADWLRGEKARKRG